MKGIEKIGGWFGEKAEDTEKAFAEAPVKKAEYKFEELRQLERPMTRIVEIIKDAIDRGEYDAIIGDDASARIPALVLREVMRQRIESSHPNLKPEEKRKKLQTYFVAGGRRPVGDSRGDEMENTWLGEQLDRDLTDFFEKIRSNIKRALFVTEYISTGKSLLVMEKLLDKAGISFDVACAVVDPNFLEMESDNDASGKHKIYIGGSGVVPGIFDKGEFSGVVKERAEGAPSWPRHARPFYGVTQNELGEARRDVKTMADRIIKKVWKEK